MKHLRTHQYTRVASCGIGGDPISDGWPVRADQRTPSIFKAVCETSASTSESAIFWVSARADDGEIRGVLPVTGPAVARRYSPADIVNGWI